MSEFEEWHPLGGIDTQTPSPARMYDYYLGGKDNFQADREAAEQVLATVPSGRATILENRRLLLRVVRYLVADVGIRQILDVGSGLPTQDNVHQVAHAIAPDTRVVYADNDPVVLTHARALLADGSPNVTVAEADMRNPAEILTAARENLDLNQPVAVLFIAVLHFIPDADDPHAAVARVRDALTPGSYLALSHAIQRPDYDQAARHYDNATARAITRSPDDIGRFFTGLDLIEPGLVDVTEWHPDGTEAPEGRGFAAGVGRKPQPVA